MSETSSYPYIFLLSKKRHYYFDQLAIAEPLAASTPARMMRGVGTNHKYSAGAPGQTPHTLSRPGLGLPSSQSDANNNNELNEGLPALGNNKRAGFSNVIQPTDQSEDGETEKGEILPSNRDSKRTINPTLDY